MNAYLQPLTEYSEVMRLKESIDRNRLPIRVSGCTDSEKCNLIAMAAEGSKNCLIIAENEKKARELITDYRLYSSEVLYYPPKDIIFYNADVHGNAIVRERIKCLSRLLSDEPVTIVTTVSAGMDKLMPLEELRKYTIHVDFTQQLDIDEFARKLLRMGYERTAEVTSPGEFTVRGGIVDVFPLAEEAPYRIELWGDDIDSIRVFDPSSQRSIDKVAEFNILPAMETVLTEEQRAAGLAAIEAESRKQIEKLRKDFHTEEAANVRKTVAEFRDNLEYLGAVAAIDSYIDYFVENPVSFFDYFKGEDSIIFLDEPLHMAETARAVELEFSESMKGRLLKGYILPGQMNAAFDCKRIFAGLTASRTVLLSTMDFRFTEIPVKDNFALNVRTISSYNSDFELLVKELTAWKKSGYRIVLLTGSKSRALRLAEDLRDRELNAFCSDDDLRAVQPGEIKVASGAASRGFEYPLIKFAIITETDIFGKTKMVKKHRKMYEGTRIPDFTQLSNGDYVVHESYGVGVYRGIEKIEVEHVIKDYIKIEYAGGGTLYVLASAMDAVQKYSGPEGKTPKINKLDSPEWKNTKAKVKGAVRQIAGELVRLYALRQAKQGHKYGRDTEWQTEFEESFPFEETDDQLKAIEETKRDMESSKIMDRLICGDVGYGKTEIAIRAAFKAVMDNKQVAVLVPTTILAQQHYNTFLQRMGTYPVRIDMLSRFRTSAEQKKALSRLKSGELNIIIGTHRLLSKDVVFKDLGLLIVDEEQRFGVTHKEKIKQLKGDVDVLTLTATPIPRTLHMSLIGIRDMSVLDEPPVDRLPIQTFVMEHNDEIIREAINRELARNGQVYFVYNRVQGISEIADRIRALVPDANVVYAHGQMSERELENVMLSFVNGEIDVLVSTTIIETGLDISNVNTIIIDDADRLGLSQLYQLRGRVGRSNRTAYAFLMYKRDKILKEDAEKRLAAIKEFTELGSGFKIAMRDLEIRGAGNLLGAEQSGQMAAVGYDLYCKLLNQAVTELKLGEEQPEGFDTMIDMDMDAYIPSTYIRNELHKLDMYKRIANIDTEELLSDVTEELCDRYGDIPVPVNNLLRIALLKAKAHSADITAVIQKRRDIKLNIYAYAKLDVARFPEIQARYGSRFKINPGKTPSFTFSIEERGKKLSAPVSNDEVFKQLTELFELMASIKIDKK